MPMCDLAQKKRILKRYETPYGPVDFERYVYQSNEGGKTYCPLDDKARIIESATPKFAQMVTRKYAALSAKEVSEDLEKNHSRPIARNFVQNMAEVIGTLAESVEEAWMYATPEQEEQIETIALGLDGTCLPTRDDGYREAMTGTISFYNKMGDRLHTTYLGAAPEHGKQKFLKQFEKEIYNVKLQYPNATYVGLADGAKVNWDFLDGYSDHKILDFFHATEYLADVSKAVSNKKIKQKTWLDEACHRLKHERNSAEDLLKEMLELKGNKLSSDVKAKLDAAITYFTNQKHRMNYEFYRAINLPIGSGVTEAACKTLVKQRLCRSGMKWKEKGVRAVLYIRALVCTIGRFEEFWERIIFSGLSGLRCVH